MVQTGSNTRFEEKPAEQGCGAESLFFETSEMATGMVSCMIYAQVCWMGAAISRDFQHVSKELLSGSMLRRDLDSSLVVTITRMFSFTR
jgi:hypothetical protein